MGVRTGIDAARLAAAAQRPGIDPRVWLVLARVTDVAFDSETGMFADVQYIPDGEKETALVGSEYAGDGFGMFVPLKTDDIVLVAVPMGDPGYGPVVIKRLFSGTAKPPGEFGNSSTPEPTDATNDPTIVVEANKTLRVVAKGGATVKFEISGTGKFQVAATGEAQVEVTSEKAIVINSPDVRLGDSAGQAVARVGDLVSGPGLQAGPYPVLPVPATPVNPPVVGQIISGKSSVKA